MILILNLYAKHICGDYCKIKVLLCTCGTGASDKNCPYCLQLPKKCPFHQVVVTAG